MLPVDHPSDRMIIGVYFWFIITPLIILIMSIIFGIYNDFQWYFALRVAILWLLYMVIFGAGSLMFVGAYFVISLTGQLIGAYLKNKK